MALAGSHSLPFASIEAFPSLGDSLLCTYADAAGEGKFEGMGFWFVVGTTCFLYCDEWSHDEKCIPIHAREAYISTAAVMSAHALFPSRNHCLEYTDNSATECVHESQSAQCPKLQIVIEARADFLDAAGVCVLPQRVSSVHNVWADWLSRGEWRRVIEAVVACGLEPLWIGVPNMASALRRALVLA